MRCVDMACLHKLEVLDVHSNRVPSLLPLTPLTSLRILNAASNHLSTLPDLSPLSHLVELNVRRNALRRVGDVAAGSANGSPASAPPLPLLPLALQRLFLEHNCISSAHELSGLAGLAQLDELGVEGNPLASRGHPTVCLLWLPKALALWGSLAALYCMRASVRLWRCAA